MFIPGETVNHQFTVPFQPSNISKAVVTYKQNGNIVLVKNVTSSSIRNGPVTGSAIIAVALTQEESLMFEDESEYCVQVNLRTTSGARAASKEMRDTTGPQHYKKVIS